MGCGRVGSPTTKASAARDGHERRTVDRSTLPATGAWLPGDPVGHRQFVTIATDHPLALDGGSVMSDITIAYETWGSLEPGARNAVLLCHAWTGDSHAAGPDGRGHATAGWW